MHSNKHKRQETQIIFLGETLKEKTPQFPHRQNEHQWQQLNPKKNMISNSLFSLSYLRELLLSHSWAPVSECVCYKQRRSLSIYILFVHLMSTSTCWTHLTITYQGRHLQEILKTLVPHNCGDFDLLSTRRVNLNSIVGTISLTYNGRLTSMNLHDFIILMALPIGTMRYNEKQMILLIGTSGYNIIYTSEYIPKLQIHQHSLLTTKVFS